MKQLAEFLPLILVSLILLPIVIASIRICSRVGWAPWLGIFMVLPPLNIILILMLGFKEWPIEKAAKGK